MVDDKMPLQVRVGVVSPGLDVDSREIAKLEADLKVVAAAKLVEAHKVSIGRAAALCGLSVARFIDELGRLHVPVIDVPPEQLKHELTRA